MPDPSSANASALALASASLARIARIARTLLALPLTRIVAAIARSLLLPLRIAALPLPRLMRILAIPFAPALYLLSYLVDAARRTLSFLASLEPIYTFLGTAAAVGFFAGIALAASSSLIVSLLSIHDDPAPPKNNNHNHNRNRNRNHSQTRRTRPLRQPRHDSDLDEDGTMRNLDIIDWDVDAPAQHHQEHHHHHQPALPAARRKVLGYRTPPAQGRRRFAAGLLSQTIMEEDDDDSDF
ncbi:hypothetical protein ESCO_000570 [Escovopsis weberi]|uniref:Uncharacterized protein n=1 Tax=Escovopsis weberi TaxID=150374 RepID=A0A0M9VUC6_ESCWE|nr:hypothetical protein ESCO_000570 [Escovopsis weberi]